jgi:hypothetical protein
MTIAEQSIATVLDETITALSTLDHERLLSLEERILLLAKSGAINNVSMPSLLQRQALLKRMLDETQGNLAVLTRLHRGDGIDAWVR